MKHSSSHLLQHKTCGKLGVITLNRPLAYNAMNLEMVLEMRTILEEFEDNIDVIAVVVRSTHPKAFCAGGDIKAAYHALIEKKIDPIHQFFDAEYSLNLYIANYTKPYIAMIDGICMGGGMGISIYASHRIVSENTVIAMPENLIGFTPDVGAFYFLNRIDKIIGYYLALTGASISGTDACHIGLSDHYVMHHNHVKLLEALTLCTDVDQINDNIRKHTSVLPPSIILEQKKFLDDVCRDRHYKSVLAKLHDYELNDFALSFLEALRYASPHSLELTDERFENEATLSLKEVLERDKQYGKGLIFKGDFSEGVRALLIDKDRKPKWKNV